MTTIWNINVVIRDDGYGRIVRTRSHARRLMGRAARRGHSAQYTHMPAVLVATKIHEDGRTVTLRPIVDMAQQSLTGMTLGTVPDEWDTPDED